jgi:hypothetical protein
MREPHNNGLHLTVGAPFTGRHAPPAGEAERWANEHKRTNRMCR